MRRLVPSIVRPHRDYRGGYQTAGLTNRARELRSAQTPAEAKLWQTLRKRQVLGFKFRRQHQFGDYIADFYCHEARLVIECDGSVHNGNEQWRHDQERDIYVISQGLRVLRFRNDEVLNDVKSVFEKIQLVLSDSRVKIAKRNKKQQSLSPSP